MAGSTDIRPDLSGDVPRCSTECPRYQPWGVGLPHGPSIMGRAYPYCGSTETIATPGSVCLPAVRQLVQLSRRRCRECLAAEEMP